MGGLLPLKTAKWISAFLALLTLAPSAVFADKYYSQSDRPGYWWGKDPVDEEPDASQEQQPAPKEEAKRKEEKKEEPQQYAWQSREEVKYSDFTPQQIWDMKPKEFDALFTTMKEQAVWRPTEEHVRDMYAMVNMARRKASAVANVQQMVVSKYPDLSTQRDYPTAVPGREAMNEMRRQEISQRVATAATDYGLIYFYKPGCPYCKAQEGILRYFVASKHFAVQPVDITQQPNVAAQFNITITPSLVLIKRGNATPLPISYGVIAMDELEIRVFNGVRALDGETTPEQYGVADYEKGGAFDPTAPLQ